jgi:hypothetical protein
MSRCILGIHLIFYTENCTLSTHYDFLQNRMQFYLIISSMCNLVKTYQIYTQLRELVSYNYLHSILAIKMRLLK